MTNIKTSASRALTNVAILSAAYLTPVYVVGQVSEDFESFAEGAFSSNGAWTINDSDADQINRSAQILNSGLSFSNSAFTINGGNRSLQLNLVDSANTDNDPINDFAIFDFSGTPVGVDGSTVEFRYLFQTSNATPSFVGIGVSGDATAARPSRTSSASLAFRNTGEEARIANSLGGWTGTNTGLNSSDGSTHLAIGRVTLNSSGEETFKLWIDPTSTDLNSLSPSSSVTAEMETTSFEAWGFYPNGQTNGTLVVDAFEMSVVPEPSAYAAIFGLGALALSLLSRRR